VRDGDWKLVWKASPPPRVVLFDLSRDKSETTNLADGNADKVRDLQGRVTAPTAEMRPPLLVTEAVRT
jgi:arylsulfatase A-like enzyme